MYSIAELLQGCAKYEFHVRMLPFCPPGNDSEDRSAFYNGDGNLRVRDAVESLSVSLSSQSSPPRQVPVP